MSLGLVIFAAVAALFVSGTVGRAIHGVDRGIDAVVTDAGFGISEIHLSGNSRVPPESILAALGMQPGESIFAAKLAAARARIMSLDWIASADVVRRYPDSIFVTVVEKRPFALWQSPGRRRRGGTCGRRHHHIGGGEIRPPAQAGGRRRAARPHPIWWTR